MAKLIILFVLVLVGCTYANSGRSGKKIPRIPRAANPLSYQAEQRYPPDHGNYNPRSNGNTFRGNNNPFTSGVRTHDDHPAGIHEDVVVDQYGRVIDKYLHVTDARGQDINIHTHGTKNHNHKSPIHKPGVIELNV